jgi:hypothetical protein
LLVVYSVGGSGHAIARAGSRAGSLMTNAKNNFLVGGRTQQRPIVGLEASL